MTGDHITEPLDYLYEELSPEGMAEARRHLAACPECRQEMRAIRETVKLYRQASHPTAPEGLAERATAAALRGMARPTLEPAVAAAKPAEPVTVLIPPPPRTQLPYPDMEKEFTRLKEEVLRDAPRGLRSWLFHPAWTVAATVIFLCAILIHLSPRMRPERPMVIPAAVERPDDAARQIRLRERIPPSAPRPQSERPAPEPPPILTEAEAVNRLDLERLLVPEDEPDTGKFTVTRKNPTALLDDTPPHAFSVRPMEAATAGAGAAAAAAPVPAPAASQPVPEDSTNKTHPETERIVSEPLTPENDQTFDGLIVEWEDVSTPPQIVPRPTPLNTEERVRTLTTLVGMQIAHREWEDAWRTVLMVAAYDRQAADNLRALVQTAQDAAIAETSTTPEPGPAPTGDEMPTTLEDAPATEKATIPEPIPEPEPASAPAVSDQISEPVHTEDAQQMSEPPAVLAPEDPDPGMAIQAMAPPAPRPTSAAGTRTTAVYPTAPGTYVADPIILPPIVMGSAGPLPRVVFLTPEQAAELHAAGRLQYAVPPPMQAQAASVPEPPESESGFSLPEPSRTSPPAPRKTSQPRERPKGFSTDPYVRGY